MTDAAQGMFGLALLSLIWALVKLVYGKLR